jgi:putative oxidoreductase
VLLGLATRLAAAPVIFFLLVGAFVQNGAESFSDKELALVYLVPFVALTLTGGGHYAFDTIILRGRAGRRRL